MSDETTISSVHRTDGTTVPTMAFEHNYAQEWKAERVSPINLGDWKPDKGWRVHAIYPAAHVPPNPSDTLLVVQYRLDEGYGWHAWKK